MKKYFRQLFEYDGWANRILIDRFEKQFPVNPRITELFSHLLSAQRIWLDRCLGLPLSTTLWRERIPEEMREDQEVYNFSWIAFVDELEEDDFDKIVTYTNSKGNTFTDSFANIMTQVINHGTFHRGNLTILMKEEGFVVDNMDFVNFLRK